MKQQIDVNGFIEFIKNLEKNVPKNVLLEDIEGYVEVIPFMKVDFAGDTIVLYETPCCAAGIIQNTPVAPWEDYAVEVFNDFTNDEEKVLIEK